VISPVPILAVDLAAKFSAMCLIDASGAVVGEEHSWGMSPATWVMMISNKSHIPDVVVVEDLPYGAGQTKTVRDVYRLQGRLIVSLEYAGNESKLVWIAPKLWQDYYKPYGMKAGDKKVARAIAVEKYGYNPPELLHKDLHGVDRVHARKTMEDHVDAFLIARYMLEQSQEYGSPTKAVDSIARLERYVR
jgi:hypothetical protein